MFVIGSRCLLFSQELFNSRGFSGRLHFAGRKYCISFKSYLLYSHPKIQLFRFRNFFTFQEFLIRREWDYELRNYLLIPPEVFSH